VTTVGWFVEPTIIETSDPPDTMERELFEPCLTVYRTPGGLRETLELCNESSPTR
jgi:acyl-CoA reductase-like NAD-dependent aldehyde dehydrogenase